MPSLKQLSCTVKYSDSGDALKEYGTTYGDGKVECYLAVPEEPSPFFIHLTSKGCIAPGLSLWVYIDGEYQCNRNKVGLSYPGRRHPKEQTGIDFRVRQKETVRSNGYMQGKAWQFHKLGETPGGFPGPCDAHSSSDLVGTIKVIVLRCTADMQPAVNTAVFGPPPDALATGLRPKHWGWHRNYPYRFSEFNFESPMNDDARKPSTKRGTKRQPATFGLDGIWDKNGDNLEQDNEKPWGLSYTGGQRVAYGEISTDNQSQDMNRDPARSPEPENQQGPSPGISPAASNAKGENLPETDPLRYSPSFKPRPRDSWDSIRSTHDQQQWEFPPVGITDSGSQPVAEDKPLNVLGSYAKDEHRSIDTGSPGGGKAGVSDPDWAKSFDGQRENQMPEPHREDDFQGQAHPGEATYPILSSPGDAKANSSNQRPKDKSSTEQPIDHKNEQSSPTTTKTAPKPMGVSEIQFGVEGCRNRRPMEYPSNVGSIGLGLDSRKYEHPFDVRKEHRNIMGPSHHVRPGKSILYLHRLSSPTYMDSIDEPYASFVFKYRTRATIEMILGIEIKESEQDKRQKYKSMSKDEVIDELLDWKQFHTLSTPSVPAVKMPEPAYSIRDPTMTKPFHSVVESQKGFRDPLMAKSGSLPSPQQQEHGASKFNPSAQGWHNSQGDIKGPSSGGWPQKSNGRSQATGTPNDWHDDGNDPNKGYRTSAGGNSDENGKGVQSRNDLNSQEGVTWGDDLGGGVGSQQETKGGYDGNDSNNINAREAGSWAAYSPATAPGNASRGNTIWNQQGGQGNDSW